MNYTPNLIIIYSLNHVYGKKSNLISLNLPPGKGSVNGTSKCLPRAEQRIQAVMWGLKWRDFFWFLFRCPGVIPPSPSAWTPFSYLYTAHDQSEWIQKLHDMSPIVHFEPLWHRSITLRTNLGCLFGYQTNKMWVSLSWDSSAALRLI